MRKIEEKKKATEKKWLLDKYMYIYIGFVGYEPSITKEFVLNSSNRSFVP
jgi:hypothetical protein